MTLRRLLFVPPVANDNWRLILDIDAAVADLRRRIDETLSKPTRTTNEDKPQ